MASDHRPPCLHIRGPWGITLLGRRSSVFSYSDTVSYSLGRSKLVGNLVLRNESVCALASIFKVVFGWRWPLCHYWYLVLGSGYPMQLLMSSLGCFILEQVQGEKTSRIETETQEQVLSPNGKGNKISFFPQQALSSHRIGRRSATLLC